MSTNLCANPGMELSIPSVSSTSYSYGNWENYHTPTQVSSPSPVHSGTYSTYTTGSGLNYCIQDFAASAIGQFDVNDIVASAWLYPVSGTLEYELIFEWDRGAGYASQSTGFSWSAGGGVTVTGYHTSASLPGAAIAANAWHLFELRAMCCPKIVELWVDGTRVGVTPPGSNVTYSVATILFGQPSGNTQDGYWDDFVLTSTPRQCGGWQVGSVGFG